MITLVPRRRLLVSTIAMFFAGTTLFAQAPSSVDVYHVGTEAAYPPFSFRSSRGTIAGFNVSLARAIGEVTGTPVTLEMAPWTDLIAGLSRGSVDVIAGMYYSEERERTFEFSQPFLVVNHLLFGRENAGAVESVSELAERTVIVMEDDISEEYLYKLSIPNLSVLRARTTEEALLRLDAGEGDYALLARLPAAYHIDRLEIENVKERSAVVFSADYCFAAPEGSDELVSTFSEALVLLRRSGRYQEIFNEWFGVDTTGEMTIEDIVPYLLYIVVPLSVVLLGALAWIRSQRALVARRTRDLEQEVAARTETEQSLEHINLVLETIQAINHTASDANTDEELAVQAGNLILGTGRCERVWITLMDNTGGVRTTVRTDRSSPLPPAQSEPSILREPIVHAGRVYGTVVVDLGNGRRFQPEDAHLLRATAEEIGYGLHGLYLSGERERLQRLLKDANIIVESSPMILFRWRAEDGWPVDYVSRNIRRFGYVPEDFTSGRMVYRDLIHPDDRVRLEAEVAGHFRNAPGSFVSRYRISCGDGSVRWVEDRTTISVDAENRITKLEGIVFDVTEEVEGKQRLEAAVAQRETLLQELYHRTKNNMQVIASMVALRSMSLNDPEAQAILREIENKIYAMALVHSKLYQSGDLSQLALDEYLTELGQLVLDSHGATADNINILVDTRPVRCLIDTAVPLGLVVAELLTNSLKHAFPDGQEGTLSLSLRADKGGKMIVEIADDGVGFSDEALPDTPDTIGLQTVRHIVELQLGGFLRLENGRGAHWTMVLPPESYDRRV